MDPTAPNNPNNPNQNSAPQSPIQPGQFVVAGDPSASAPQTQSAPQTSQATSTEPAAPVPGMSFAQERPVTDPMSPTPPDPIPNMVPGQPDPVPFTTPGLAQQNAPAPGTGGGSKMKIIIIIVAILIIAGIIAAAVFMFVLPKTNSKTATSVDQTVVTEPSPPPQRTDGGFGQLPQSTTGAQPAGSSQPATGNELTVPPINP